MRRRLHVQHGKRRLRLGQDSATRGGSVDVRSADGAEARGDAPRAPPARHGRSITGLLGGQPTNDATDAPAKSGPVSRVRAMCTLSVIEELYPGTGHRWARESTQLHFQIYLTFLYK